MDKPEASAPEVEAEEWEEFIPEQSDHTPKMKANNDDSYGAATVATEHDYESFVNFIDEAANKFTLANLPARDEILRKFFSQVDLFELLNSRSQRPAYPTQPRQNTTTSYLTPRPPSNYQPYSSRGRGGYSNATSSYRQYPLQHETQAPYYSDYAKKVPTATPNKFRKVEEDPNILYEKIKAARVPPVVPVVVVPVTSNQ